MSLAQNWVPQMWMTDSWVAKSALKILKLPAIPVSSCIQETWHLSYVVNYQPAKWMQATHMVVSWNRGTPKSSILMGFSLVNQPFSGSSNFWKPPYGSMITTPRLLHLFMSGWSRWKIHGSFPGPKPSSITRMNGSTTSSANRWMLLLNVFSESSHDNGWSRISPTLWLILAYSYAPTWYDLSPGW